MLLLFAGLDGAGALRRTYLVRDDERLGLWDEGDGEARPLPEGALDAVLRRYGRPLEEGVAAPTGPALVLGGDGGTLRLWPFQPFGYLQPLDYLLWEPAAGEPLCAPAPLVAAALRALADAATRPG